MPDKNRLAALDHAHVWHPFTPMRQWCAEPPLVIDAADGDFLIDTDGRRYLDGTSSLWCNVHGHRVPTIDQAIRDQLDRVAHTTLLGLASTPSIELAAELIKRAPLRSPHTPAHACVEAGPLTRVFYSDAGATALEVAFKMAVGYWFHTGRPEKHKFIGLAGAYHGDTTGAMSVGFSELFHRPFLSMVFPVTSFPAPDALRFAAARAPARTASDKACVEAWPSENPAILNPLTHHCLTTLEQLLTERSHETAAIVIEPVMQGAAGMIPQPPGFVRAVADLARKHDVLLIADEVATGFGRTGKLFACEHDGVTPDILCLAKGISAGYLPLAATLTTDRIYDAFTGELSERRTLYHGHTYTGNALACAAGLASLRLFDETDLLAKINDDAAYIAGRLDALRDPRDFPHVLDVRQRGLMIGIELGRSRDSSGVAEPFDFAKRTAANLCKRMRDHGVILRPLGDVLVLMPIPAMQRDNLARLLDVAIDHLRAIRID